MDVKQECIIPIEDTSQEISEELQEESFEDVPHTLPAVPDEATIEAHFRETALRIVLQRNDFLLPNLLDMMTVHKTINISPFCAASTMFAAHRPDICERRCATP